MSYTRGTTATLFANFLTAAGIEPTTITGAKITIRHIDPVSDTLEIDVNEVAMTLAAESLYYYKWNIPADADITTYDIEYEATVDGVYTEASENIQVLSAAPQLGAGATAYTTKALVAEILGVSESDISDSWIDWATRYINSYTCRDFAETETTEKYDIETDNTDTIFTEHFPIISVTYVKDNGTTLDSVDYLIYNKIGVIKLQTVDELTTVLYPYFTEGRQKVEVKYTYGYTNIPHEITYAATLIAARIAKQHLPPSSSDVTEKQIGDTRIRYSASGTGSSGGSLGISIADIQNNILSKYKRKEGLGV